MHMMASKSSLNNEPQTVECESEISFQQKIESLLGLVEGRRIGKLADEEVEDAVSSLLSKVVPTSSQNGKNDLVLAPNAEDKNIVADEEDYDGDGDGDVENVKANDKNELNSKDSESNVRGTIGDLKWTGDKATIESLKIQEANQESKERAAEAAKMKKFDLSEQWDQLDAIPLGRTGARMMVTFGDGTNPTPGACSAALMGTRQCLQNAIKDARALRRKTKEEFNRARIEANMHRAKRKEREILQNAPECGGVDPDMLFRAIGGFDKISYDPECGFDDSQLLQLFPEEMNAYQRWKKLHKAYTDSSDDKKTSKIKLADDDDEENEEEENTVKHDSMGGHLEDRLAQFDARTDRMKKEWYMAFSEVRKGSFLPRTSTQEERDWEKIRKTRAKDKKRSRKRTYWENLPASHVQFLHWIGFDQRSALSPPNEETTHALAFLGYDFFGKIVEKAIFLRRLEQREMNRNKAATNSKLILQMEGDEQLTKEDIEKALNDSTVISKPLYSAMNSVLNTSEAAQLYFGPGFEDRIEMEMEQIILSKKNRRFLTEEEKEIRAKEEEFFEKLKEPPTLLEGVMDILGDQLKNEGITEMRQNDKVKQRKKDTKRAFLLSEASGGKNEVSKSPRRQRKPKSKDLQKKDGGDKNEVSKSPRQQRKPKSKEISTEASGVKNEASKSPKRRRKQNSKDLLSEASGEKKEVSKSPKRQTTPKSKDEASGDKKEVSKSPMRQRKRKLSKDESHAIEKKNTSSKIS